MGCFKHRPVREFGCGDNLRNLTRSDDLAAVGAGLWSEIDDVVGAPHCFFVMLDDDE